MAHSILSFRYPRRHPGSTRAGNIGFYAVIGMAVVALLLMFGLFALAQNALQGIAAVVQPAVS